MSEHRGFILHLKACCISKYMKVVKHALKEGTFKIIGHIGLESLALITPLINKSLALLFLVNVGQLHI